MTNRELRTRRRAEERKASKLARTNHVTTDGDCPSTDFGFVSQNAAPSKEPAPRLQANRDNAQLSTGPRTPAGKLASSRNSFKHGLSTGQVIIPGENQVGFDALLAALQSEYQPATVTEELLIKEMAESHWLAQRALRLQNDCFGPDGVDHKRLALYLRYQATHQRAFHKALNTLRSIQKDRRKQPIGFVSQPHHEPAPGDDFASQNANRTAADSIEWSNRKTPEAA